MRELLCLASLVLSATVAVATQVSFVGSAGGVGGSKGLTISPDGDHIYLTGAISSDLAIYGRDATSGAATLLEVVTQVPELIAPLDVTISGDGLFVYVAGNGFGLLSVFERNAGTGSLTFVTSYGTGAIPALFGVSGVLVSPDDAHLYVLSFASNALLGFLRNPVTGELTQIGQAIDGSGGVDGLDGPSELAISPDGAHIYVAGFNEDAVAVFSRDAGTGILTFVEVQRDGVGVEGVGSLAISGDGAHVYAGGETGLTVFSRDAGTGALTFVEYDDQGGSLVGPSGVAVTPDGSHVYVGALVSNSFAVFDRDAGTGEVTVAQLFDDTSVLAGAIVGGDQIRTDSSGDFVYLSASGGVTVFRHSAVECSPSPLGGCFQPSLPGKAKLVIKDSPLDQKDTLVWKWVKGEAVTLGDYGDPASTLNDYALCIYDAVASEPIVEALAPAGGGCGKESLGGATLCWKAKSTKGFAFKGSKLRHPHGVKAMKLLAGDAGRPKVIVKGKGELVPMPVLPLAFPLTVQAQNANGACWEATYSAALVNDAVLVKATSD